MTQNNRRLAVRTEILPAGTTAQPYSYATTTTDESGTSQPSTAYELHCVDANGVVVKKDPVLYAFLWIGLIAAIGLVIAALLALALAAPAGIVITRRRSRQAQLRTTGSANINSELFFYNELVK